MFVVDLVLVANRKCHRLALCPLLRRNHVLGTELHGQTIRGLLHGDQSGPARPDKRFHSSIKQILFFPHQRNRETLSLTTQLRGNVFFFTWNSFLFVTVDAVQIGKMDAFSSIMSTMPIWKRKKKIFPIANICQSSKVACWYPWTYTKSNMMIDYIA